MRQDFWKLAQKNTKVTHAFPISHYREKQITNQQRRHKRSHQVSESEGKEAIEFREAFSYQKSPYQAPPILNTQHSLSPISLEMLQHAIRKMKPNKTGGPDGLTAECFKHLPEHMVAFLSLIFQAVSRLKITPKVWQNNFVKLIFKKGETTAISNYRPIALLNTIFKLWETILFFKLQEELNMTDSIEQAQFGSQKDKGSIEAIVAINLIKEVNAHLPLYTATIDLSKHTTESTETNYGSN